MREDKYKIINQFDFDYSRNGYSQWSHGTFFSSNSGNLIGLDYFNYIDKLDYVS